MSNSKLIGPVQQNVAGERARREGGEMTAREYNEAFRESSAGNVDRRIVPNMREEMQGERDRSEGYSVGVRAMRSSVNSGVSRVQYFRNLARERAGGDTAREQEIFNRYKESVAWKDYKKEMDKVTRGRRAGAKKAGTATRAERGTRA